MSDSDFIKPETWVEVQPGEFSRIPNSEISERVAIALRELKQLKEKAKLDEIALIELRKQNNQFRLENEMLHKLHFSPENGIDLIALAQHKIKFAELSIETQLSYLEYFQVHQEIYSEIVFLSRGKAALDKHREEREQKKKLTTEKERKVIAEGKKPSQEMKPNEYIYSEDPGENKAIKGMIKRFFDGRYSPENVAAAKKMVEGMKKR